MARGKRRGRRRGKDWIQLAFNVLGAVVAGGPAIKAVLDNRSNPSGIPAAVLFNYTGMDPAGNWQWNQAVLGIGQVAGGAVVASIPKIFRKIKGMVR